MAEGTEYTEAQEFSGALAKVYETARILSDTVTTARAIEDEDVRTSALNILRKRIGAELERTKPAKRTRSAKVTKIRKTA